LYLDTLAVNKAATELLRIKHKTLNDTVQFLSNNNARLNPNVIPQKGAVYVCKQSSKTSNFPPQTIQHFSIE